MIAPWGLNIIQGIPEENDLEGLRGWTAYCLHMGFWFSIRAEEWSGQRVHQSDSLILSRVGVRKHWFNALWKGCRLLGWQESGCTIERYCNTSPEESPSRMTTAIHLRQLLPFSFCSLRPKKSHETEPQWGGKYKAYIYVTVVYWMSREISSLFLSSYEYCRSWWHNLRYISPTFSPNYIKLRAIFLKSFAVLPVKNYGFLAPRLGIRGI